MNRTKKAGLSVKSGLSLMCIVCLLCGLLCGFFWLAGESSALAAGPDGSAPAAKTVVSGDVSLAAPERDEKLAVQAAAQATSPVVRTVAVGMDAGDYTETVTCDYTPVYVDDRFGGYCYVLDDAVWLPADAFAEMLGLESDTVTDGDTETVTVDGADIAATYGETYYTANGRCFYAPDGVYALERGSGAAAGGSGEDLRRNGRAQRGPYQSARRCLRAGAARERRELLRRA